MRRYQTTTSDHMDGHVREKCLPNHLSKLGLLVVIRQHSIVFLPGYMSTNIRSCKGKLLNIAHRSKQQLILVAVRLDSCILPKLGKMIPSSSLEILNSRVTNEKINTISKQDGGSTPNCITPERVVA